MVNSFRVAFFKLTNRKKHYNEMIQTLERENKSLEYSNKQIEKKQKRKKKIIFFLYLIDFHLLRVYHEIALFRYF